MTGGSSASPAGRSLFRPGTLVTYTFVVTNTGNVTLDDVTIIESRFTGTGALGDISCLETDPLAPEAQTRCTSVYRLTQSDIDRGEVDNTALATALPPTGPATQSADDSAVLPEAPAPALRLDKSATPGTVTRAGRDVTYHFAVTNTGNVPLATIAIDEQRFTGTGTVPTPHCPELGELAPGERIECTATYTVVAADLSRASISNTAVATATDAETSINPVLRAFGTARRAGPVRSSPSTAVVRIRGTIPATGGAAISVHKSGALLGATKPSSSRVGDHVRWQISVTNTGTTALADITVTDPSAGEVTCPRTRLSPGVSMVCTVPDHLITAADVARGVVTNTAQARAADVVTSATARVVIPATALAPAIDTDTGALPRTGSPVSPALVLAGFAAIAAGVIALAAGRRGRSRVSPSRR